MLGDEKMFLKIRIDNFCGISSPIELDFVAKSRNKRDNPSVIELEEGVFVNKINGIIGGNASGKTSILAAVNSIGNILIRRILQYNFEDKFNEMKRLLNEEPNSQDRKIINDFFDEFETSTDISFQNVKRKYDPTILEVEMYILSKDEEFTGYYDYRLSLDGINRKINREYLGFRKRYKGNTETIVDILDSKQSQVFYINSFFQNIVDIDKRSKEQLELKYKYIKTFVKHYIDNSHSISAGWDFDYKEVKYVELYNKNPQIFVNLTKIVDSKISNVLIDTDKENPELQFMLNDGSKLTRHMLSTGTKKFLSLMGWVNEIIEKNGILIVDEIEQNLHKDLVGFIIRLFGEMSKNNSQIIFTTLSPEIFDILNKDKKKIFKQDSVYVLNSENDDVKIDRLMDLIVDGARVNGDASVYNLYKNKKMSLHPDEEQIDEFFNKFSI